MLCSWSQLCSVAVLRSVLLRYLVVRFLVELDEIRELVCVDLVPLRYHVSVQVVSAAWRARVRFCLCAHRVRGHTLVGPPTAFLCRGTGVPWVSLPGPTSVPSDAQAGWHREQSANPSCGRSRELWCACSLRVHVCLGKLTLLLDGLRWHKLAIVCVSSSLSVQSS